MVYILATLVVLILMVSVAEATWVFMVHFILWSRYAQMFDNTVRAFDVESRKCRGALDRNDLTASNRHLANEQLILDRQDHYLRAMRAVSSAAKAPPWKWLERWRADYLDETKAA